MEGSFYSLYHNDKHTFLIQQLNKLYFFAIYLLQDNRPWNLTVSNTDDISTHAPRSGHNLATTNLVH
jgi:hypothetical protein